MFKERILIKTMVDGIVKFLARFDKDRTIGSITKKEIEKMFKEDIKKMKL